MSLIFSTLSFCLFTFSASAVSNSGPSPTSAQIDVATRTARCRAHCIDAFWNRLVNADVAESETSTINSDRCLADSHCWMCWDYCEMLEMDYSRWGNMCRQRQLCLDGCRVACAVYEAGSYPGANTYQSDHWSFPFPPKIDAEKAAGWLRLGWPSVVPLRIMFPPLPHVVYVVFWQPDKNKSWMQLEQTLSTVYETRHGDIVIGGSEAQFLILAVTRDGLVATGTPGGDDTTIAFDNDASVAPIFRPQQQLVTVDPSDEPKLQFLLVIVGSSILAGCLFSAGLVFIYRMIKAQRRRNLLSRANAIRFRTRSRQSRKRTASESSRRALVTNLNVAKLQLMIDEPRLANQTASADRYTPAPDHSRFEDLFKGTIFESPPPFPNDKGTHRKVWPTFSFFNDRSLPPI